jgi:tetratricopeptide (TPR) repeat protein
MTDGLFVHNRLTGRNRPTTIRCKTPENPCHATACWERRQVIPAPALKLSDLFGVVQPSFCAFQIKSFARAHSAMNEGGASSADRHANLGWFYAFAGRKDEAIREGRRAVELKPESKDAVDGAIMNCYLALIYARVGEKELAIPLIERLLKTSGAVDSVDYSITVNDLKHRWEWDPIRNDPRFQKMVANAARD